MGKFKKIKTIADVRELLLKRKAYQKKILKRLYAKREELKGNKLVSEDIKKDYMLTFIIQAKGVITEIEVMLARLEGDYSSSEKNFKIAKRELPIIMKEMEKHAKEHAEGKFSGHP